MSSTVVAATRAYPAPYIWIATRTTDALLTHCNGSHHNKNLFHISMMDLTSVVLLSLTLRWLVTLSGYSGEHTPPRYGDFEAQRHWMEVTVNLQIGDWYRPTPENDLDYWGLDYPPLTAYVSWICGLVSRSVEPASVALGSSRGYETSTHRVFMRLSVLLLDALVYFPAAWALASALASSLKRGSSRMILIDDYRGRLLLLALLQPALVLIDHGHFQVCGQPFSLGIFDQLYYETNLTRLT